MLFWLVICSFLVLRFDKNRGIRYIMYRSWSTILSLLVISQLTSAKVLLIGKNTILSFDDIEATFTPTVRGSGEWGLLYVAEPLDACSDLTKMAEKGSTSYVLIVRGGCSFEEKVRKAQKAGYKAAIVYNNEYDQLLVPMGGNSSDVHVHGVLVTRASGEILKEYAGQNEIKLWLIPGFVTSSWSIMAITFISMLVMSTLLATCFFAHRHRIIRWHVNSLFHGGQGFSGMSRNMLQSMPTEVFNGVHNESSTSVTCAICIEDYLVGDKLKMLPCQHKFHAACIDSWLGHWRSFCPVCKRNVRTRNDDPPASETTPLLSPSLNSITSPQTFYDLPISLEVYML